MKESIENLLDHALNQLISSGVIETKPALQITRTKDAAHGDFTCNVAMMLAKQAGKPPREIAQIIIDALTSDDAIKQAGIKKAGVEKIKIAGPGFINFFLAQENTLSVIKNILSSGDNFGKSNAAKNEKVQIEFVSANPTGPLHVGHGRGAAYGATLASLMRAVGFDVDCEYYVNDAGRQMNILATSIWLRYLQENAIDISFPSNGYKSEEYIYDITRALKEKHGDAFVHNAEIVMKDIPADEPDGGDKEQHIDALIERAQTLLGNDDYRTIFKAGLDSIIDDIRTDLEEFGVHYQTWYSEQSLADRDLINKAVKQLQDAGHVYEDKGALWFRSTNFGDEKDRVVVRDNGQGTYFASDIAYHLDKFARGYERVINVWGADHHGYVPRVKAALTAMGKDENKLDILLVQFANLYRNGQRLQMSTRSGSFVTLRELREEVGNDAARFFYVMRKCEQHMDFDLDLAKSQSNDNPVYYIQYAHARICRVIEQLAEKKLQHNIENGFQNLNLLTEKHETELISKLDAYADIVHKSAFNAEPHLLVHYLRELATLLHSYYNAHQFIIDDENMRDARFNLIIATKQVLHNGLTLLGVSAPDKM
ncbi:Arginyl-tRNA synthetase [hydrothermal vent metagenome]|uniref:arginine--tRNA ligase n=1 Tax=hydrothermal vent metagenome TaxID=652676 RepID=A0A3B0WDD6_9ZZZZ